MREAIVIGAGVDERVAAHLLVRAGWRVTLLEERTASAPQAIFAPLARKLGLQPLKHPDPWLNAMLPGGGALELWRDVQRSAESIRRLSPADARKWPAFCERMAWLRGLLESIYLEPPPGLVDLRFALRLRGLGRQAIEDLLRLLPMPAAELLDEWFECDALKGALAAFAVRDLKQGPRSAGTAFRLLHSSVGAPAGVFRSPFAALAQPLEIAARSARVAAIRVREGRTAGVALQSGEEISGSLVVSGADPRHTLLELIEPGWLDPELVRALRALRSRGVRATIRGRLDAPPKWSTLTFAPTVDYVERAYDPAKYGRISAQPWVDAEASGTAVKLHFQYAPHEVEGGWDASKRAMVAQAASELTGAWFGGMRDIEVLAPPDLERIEGWPQGQPDGVELSLDQALWMRPLPELAGYRAPIEGLWLCGPAMHPGGVGGASGYNCAREILRS